jgi:hypothetical protein
MITPITLLRQFTLVTGRARWSGLSGLASLAALVMLAAGCGTVTTPPAGGGSGHGQTPASPASAASGSAGSGSAAPGTVSGSPVPTTTGGPFIPGQPACAGWPANAPHGSLPASFVPVAVIRCVNSYQTIPGKGQWEVATLERADENLAPLITALRHPSGGKRPGMMCPEIAMVPPQFVLVGGGGKMLVPQLPLSGCGLVQPQVLAALSALSWQPVSVRLVSQIQTPQEMASGCTPQYRDPFTASEALRPSSGRGALGPQPASLRICVYTSGGAASGAQFLRAATVTGPKELELLAGLVGAGRSGLCTLPHGKFAVLGGPNGPMMYVELGGCDRVVRYESGAGGLMGLSVGQATPAAVATIESLTHS